MSSGCYAARDAAIALRQVRVKSRCYVTSSEDSQSDSFLYSTLVSGGAGMLPGLGGIYGTLEEIDIENLGSQEKRNLIERLVHVAEEYNEKFLLKLKERMNW
ncbi:hypothetical protein Sjap_004098 [Stephania japonica]|uniref:Uncharacterized protein n=1 Tax=Stephania japonica TaxID=461633 RepID=A0AAP0K3U3_9MAGN